jgi:iron complex outermembrane receptor protein
MNSARILLVLPVVTCLAVPPALAQSGSALEEIVVTARKRDESFQDVPVAVTVFNAQTIEDAGIERPQDYIGLTPNMSMVQTQNQGTSFITVRGISQARNSEPSVAVLIDGVLQANPSQFNQELYDVESIEVLKGPQGALYGRNAIGGAIIIRTKEPTDEMEGSITAGYESGPGFKVRGALRGPFTDTLKYSAAFSYFDTDGHINNPYLDEEADPFRDISGRAKLLWEPNDDFKADLRFYISQVDTQALYFNITRDSNDTSLPVRVNNEGDNERDMWGVSLKMDYETDYGTATSITAYDSLQELLTGDQFDFVPNIDSVLFNCPLFFCGVDQAQHQWLDVDAISQEFRFTSPSDQRFRWIAGAYMIATDRFISTGNVFDCSETTFLDPFLDCAAGVINVKRDPLPIFFPQASFLSDTQDNFAWAVFGEMSYDITERLEGSVALRYDHDNRENRTDTPQVFLDILVNPFVDPDGVEGQKREHTWDALQPKFTLRWTLQDNFSLYTSYSRGFRSGGFNQTGVGAAGIAGVSDLFDEETADTFEAGFKSTWFDGRMSLNASIYKTMAEGSYFFVFDPNTSTQNLGNLEEVDYMGFEIDATANITEGLDAYAAFGYTDSDIQESSRNPADVGNEAPLVSEYTFNVGAQWRHALGMWDGVGLFLRADYQIIGPTYWYPDNFTTRHPVNLLDLRGGLEGENWAITAWSKNVNDEEYNAEWSPGPNFGAFPFPNPGYSNNFVFKAQPRTWGVDFTYRF